jgi:hypothetical protein
VTNLVNTNVSGATLNLSTGLTTGTLLATTSISTGALSAPSGTVTNVIASTMTSGNIVVTTSSTTAPLLVVTPNSGYGMRHTDNTISLETFVGGGSNSGQLGTTTAHPLGFFSNNGGVGICLQTNGNVGINTTVPSSKLQVNGSLAKTSGTFDIEHPVILGKRLVHSFIEGPRCDLIYRGTINLVNGQANVNLDKACVANEDCSMTEGTFEALCTNPVKYLHNNTSFSRVRGVVSGNVLTIYCEDSTSTDSIDWMVVAERKDSSIKEWERTNDNGYLITEYTV